MLGGKAQVSEHFYRVILAFKTGNFVSLLFLIGCSSDSNVG